MLCQLFHLYPKAVINRAFLEAETYLDTVFSSALPACSVNDKILHQDWLCGRPHIPHLVIDASISVGLQVQDRWTGLASEESMTRAEPTGKWLEAASDAPGATNVVASVPGFLSLCPRTPDTLIRHGWIGLPRHCNAHVDSPGNVSIHHVDGYGGPIHWLCLMPDVQRGNQGKVIKLWWRWPSSTHNLETLIKWEAAR